MKRFFYISFLILLASCSRIETIPSKFDLDQHRDKFQHQRFEEINIDSIHFDFKKDPLDSTEFVSVFQEEFNRKIYESNPCYFYSIQSETSDYSSVSILEYHEALSTELILLNHNKNGKLIDKKTIAISGADGSWEFGMKSKYIDSINVQSVFYERTWEDSNYASTVTTYFERNETFHLDETGSFVTKSLDSLSTTEEHIW
jgi:hypothetical protein